MIENIGKTTTSTKCHSHVDDINDKFLWVIQHSVQWKSTAPIAFLVPWFFFFFFLILPNCCAIIIFNTFTVFSVNLPLVVFHLTISYPLVSKTCSKSLMNTTSVLSFFNTQTWVTLNYFTIRLCDIYIPNICFLSKFIAISLPNIWALLNTLCSRIKAALKKKSQFRWKKY